jgi:hypothetical protein
MDVNNIEPLEEHPGAPNPLPITIRILYAQCQEISRDPILILDIIDFHILNMGN